MLKDKLENIGVDQHLQKWIVDYLTNHREYARTQVLLQPGALLKGVSSKECPSSLSLVEDSNARTLEGEGR